MHPESQIVTELRNRHARGESHAGINVRRGTVSNMLEENVVQPLLVTTSALTLATECVRMILKVRLMQLARVADCAASSLPTACMQVCWCAV